MYRQLTPASQLLDPDAWPGDFIQSDRDNLLDSIYVVDSSFAVGPSSLALSLRILFDGELALSFPGFEGIALVLGVPAEELPLPEPEDGFTSDSGPGEGWTELALSLKVDADGWRLTLRDTSFELRFADSVLRPVDGSDVVKIGMRGDLTIDDAFDITFSGFDAFDLAACEIGRTGLILAASGVTLDLARLSSPPAVLAAGFDEAFLGVYLEAATVQLPDWLTAADGELIVLGVSNAALGSGGFGGTLSYAGGELAARLFGFSIALQTANLAFVQNVITGGTIAGRLTLPFFDAALGVAVSIGPDGGARVQITDVDAASDGLATVPLGGLGSVQLSSLEIDVAGTPAIAIGGTLVPGDLAGLLLPTAAIERLRIAADGTVALEGDGLTLQDQAVVDLYGFQMEVTAVSFGTEERLGTPWNWFGFAGSVRLGEGLPAGASSMGMRVLSERGGGGFAVELDDVSCSFGIPGVLTIAGSVSLQGQELVGGVLFKLSSMDLAVNASLVAGHQEAQGERFSYFKVDLDASLPLGIPLGSTGLALYGFAGLFAQNMVPDQAFRPLDGEELDWFRHWYTDWDEPWTAQRGGLGLGVGVTLGTVADNGFTFADQVALVFSFPGPIIMLQGVGNILRPRSSLPDDSTFTSLILFDGAAGDLLAALAMSYALPADGPLAGRLLEAGGTAEAYFDLNDADNWHVYLGEKPQERRIRASAMGLFQADAYLMLDKPTLKAGVSIGYTDGWDFEVVAATLEAWLGADAKLSWAPQHLKAGLDFRGQLKLEDFGAGMGLSLEAGVDVEVPTPYSVELELEVTLDLPWPLDDLELTIDLEWSEQAEPSPEAPVVHEACALASVTTDAWTLPLASDPNTENDDRFYPSRDGQVLTVPLDARPALVFNRNVEDVRGIGTPRPASGPEIVESEINGTYEFRYRLTGLMLQKWAVRELGVEEWTGDRDVTDPVRGDTLKGLKVYGSWQATGDAAGTQLELYGDGPFSFCRDNASTRSGQASDAPPWTPYVDGFLSTRPTYPAAGLGAAAVDFEAFATSQNLGHRFVHAGLTFESGADIVISDTTAVGGRKCIRLAQQVSLVIRFPEPVGRLVLTLQGLASPGGLPLTRRATVRGTPADGTTVNQAVGLGEALDEPIIKEVALDERFVGVTSLELRGYLAYLLGLGYIPAASLDEVGDLVEAGQRLLEPRPLLLPETDYRLTIWTETVTTTPAGTTSAPQVRYAFFRTGGPPTDLTPYLATTVPAHGNGPHFGGYDLRFEFNQSYVLAMYGEELTLDVVDDNGLRVGIGEDTGRPILVRAGVVASAAYALTSWLGALTDAELLDVEAIELPENDVLVSWLDGPALLPAGRRLEARLVYRGSPVLALPFTTSRYADFSALVGAFSPTVWNEALPDGMPTATGLEELQAIAAERAAASGRFTDAEGAQFERALYDLLGSDTRPIPLRPELTALCSNGEALALLMEMPEPPEWDRLSLAIHNARGAINATVVRGRDRTRALLLIPGLARRPRPRPWAPDAYTLTLAYVLDPGDATLPVLSRRGASLPEAPPAVTLVVTALEPPAGRPSCAETAADLRETAGRP
jgi:hypothetical protein